MIRPSSVPLSALPLAALCVAAGVALTPATAVACGGLFCDSVALTPVDQAAERVLFEVNDDGTITATVEIGYSGSPSDFSWVVPVPDTPELGIVPPSTLRLLDGATGPFIIPPPISFPGWGGDDDGAMGDDDDQTSGDDDDQSGGVAVNDLPQVGPFDPQVISSDDPGALIDWLNDNGYLITPEMEPAVAGYVLGGMKFLGMKMAPEAGVSDIAPISMTYPATQPMLPIVLTSVAAEPEMSVIVFVFGDDDYESANYVNVEVDRDLVKADPRNGANNYFSLLSWQADQVGGRAFFKQFAGTGAMVQTRLAGVFLGTSDEAEANEAVLAIVGRHARMTRLYTRISPSEMQADPMFSPTRAETLDNVINLSGRPAIWWDTQALPTPPCADTYCGQGSCAVDTSGVQGCVCDTGFAARRVEGPRIANLNGLVPQPRVTCQDRRFDMMESMGDGGACLWSCGGAGVCERIGGMSTCLCDAGYVAVPFSGALVPEPVTCRPIAEQYPVTQLLWPSWPTPDEDEAEEAETPPGPFLLPVPPACLASQGPGPGAPFAVLLLGFVALRLRRGRGAGLRSAAPPAA